MGGVGVSNFGHAGAFRPNGNISAKTEVAADESERAAEGGRRGPGAMLKGAGEIGGRGKAKTGPDLPDRHIGFS